MAWAEHTRHEIVEHLADDLIGRLDAAAAARAWLQRDEHLKHACGLLCLESDVRVQVESEDLGTVQRAEMNWRYVSICPSGGAQYRYLASICEQYDKVVGCAMVCGSRYDETMARVRRTSCLSVTRPP